MSSLQECPLVSSEDSSERHPRTFGEDEGIELENIQVNKDDHQSGLTSEEAYLRLCEIIRHELVVFNYDNDKKWSQNFINILLNHERRSVFSWTSLIYILLEITLLLFGSLLHDDRKILSLVESVIILIISLTNIVLCVKEENLRRTEVPRKVNKFLSQCLDFKKKSSWSPSSYPNLTTPNSDSLSLVWTYRNEKLVNVPSNLLVEGDVIVLAPGQKSPATVQQLLPTPGKVLNIGEIFHPDVDNTDSQSFHNKIFSFNPCPRQRFTVVEAPLKDNLRKTFLSSQKRSLTALDNRCYYVTKQVIEYKLIPIIIVASFVVNLLRYILSESDVGHWSQMFFTLQAYVFIPLLPLVFPLMWIGINCYGSARIQAIFNSRNCKEQCVRGSDFTTTTSTTTYTSEESLSSTDVRRYFWSNLNGDSRCLTRTSTILHTLGSISVWCCVDKDGILALPNLYAEKVFFFRKKKDRRHKKSLKMQQSVEGEDFVSASMDDEHDVLIAENHSEKTEDEGDSKTRTQGMASPPISPREFSTLASHSEVLNLTCDPQSEFGIIFDDFRWGRHLSSLKPLGLNVLLNSPCSSPADAVKFSDHLGHLSLLFNDTPIRVIRRCLCLLGKQIGFVDSALKNFRRKQNIFAFRTNQVQLNDSMIQSYSFLSVCKENPIPFLTSLVVEHVPSGSHQLLSQGSADLLLDVCTDFWDGSEVHPLTNLERKKIRDFFHRTSITSNCVALSYRPITQPFQGTTQDVFLEIPDDVHWDYSDSDNGSMSSSKSSSSVENEEIKGGHNSNNEVDVDFYQRIIGGQIFIGMITLQHQAKQDIPPLVEDLNKAGVRFVHFSDENEIKSRVFAERLGLETGWNCHISFSEKSAGFDEHSTLTGGSDCKTEETGAEHMEDDGDKEIALHHIPDDQGGEDDAVVTREVVDEDEGHTDHIEINVNEDVEKKVKWRESVEENADNGRDRKYSDTSSSSSSSNNEEGGGTQAAEYWELLQSTSNRAKLPRGIQNIRPHLQKVDNVPLLVPLFTDCTPEATREMVKIMQENGEVVCCVGSSLNIDNIGVFNQANISIAIQPTFPQVCLKDHNPDIADSPPLSLVVGTLPVETDHLINTLDAELTPIELSSTLNGIPCSLSFGRDYKIKFVSLLKEARRCCFGLQNCFNFMLSCQLTLSLVMLAASFLLLPPPLSGLHLLWLSCLSVPLLCITLVNVSGDSDIMTMVTAKNDQNFVGYIWSFVRFFGAAFAPCVLISDLIIFPLTLMSFCQHFATENKCQYFLGNRNSTEYWNGVDDTQGLALAQDVVAFFLVLCFVFMSSSYVHRLSPLWKKSPSCNKQWMVAVCIVIILQVLFTLVSQLIWQTVGHSEFSMKHLPVSVLCVVFLWPILQLIFCELLKRKYIKFFIRYQKRAKLKFGTKLGMNSPF